jgi:hypothetical protein
MIKLLDILSENLEKPQVGTIIKVTNVNPQDFPGKVLPAGYENIKVGDELKLINTWRNLGNVLFGTDKAPKHGLYIDDIENFTSSPSKIKSEATFTSKYDDSPKLKGKQTKLPDEVQAKIVKENDHEVSMAQASLKSIIKSAAQLMNKLGNKERDIPGWIQDHVTNAENYIDQAAQGFHELDYDKETYNQIQELFGFGKKETSTPTPPKPSQGFSERFSQVNKEAVELAKKVENLIDSNITDSTQKRELKMAILNLTQNIVEEFNR